MGHENGAENINLLKMTMQSFSNIKQSGESEEKQKKNTTFYSVHIKFVLVYIYNFLAFFAQKSLRHKNESELCEGHRKGF